MRRAWVYRMLLNESGNVVGFSRDNGCVEQYADLRTDRWFRERIPAADRVILRNPPEGLRTLKGCR